MHDLEESETDAIIKLLAEIVVLRGLMIAMRNKGILPPDFDTKLIAFAAMQTALIEQLAWRTARGQRE